MGLLSCMWDWIREGNSLDLEPNDAVGNRAGRQEKESRQP
jgi:hypothetical protein